RDAGLRQRARRDARGGGRELRANDLVEQAASERRVDQPGEERGVLRACVEGRDAEREPDVETRGAARDERSPARDEERRSVRDALASTQPVRIERERREWTRVNPCERPLHRLRRAAGQSNAARAV